MEPTKTTAFGGPGIEPRWTHGGKDGVGTAYAASSRIWFTVWNGIVTEVYYPTVDRPQLRDLQYLVTDGHSFFHEEKRHLKSTLESLPGHALGYRCTNSDPAGRYSIVKEIIADAHLDCILQHTTLIGDEAVISGLRLYALCAPHLEKAGWGNNGYVIQLAGRKILVAERKGTWLAMAATVPFSRVSCGYVGKSDGWTDIDDNFQMDWQFDEALDGNIALTGELDLTVSREFTLGLAFGNSRHQAVSTLVQSISTSFTEHRTRYLDQWTRSGSKIFPLDELSGDGGRLYRTSFNLLRAHEDKSYPGAFIASLSIPWGEVVGDENEGGYHLVWTRDMCNSSTAILAAGDKATALRALIYLSVTQRENGGFAQNFWINGEPYWQGIQLDEVAFPVILAWRLRMEDALQNFDPYPMVLRAVSYVMRYGPLTPQERWEEVSGYSPSTLASNIAALICAACFAWERGEEKTAIYLEQYADFLESHVDRWTATTEGTLVPGIPRHYIRILPRRLGDPDPLEDPNQGDVTIANRAPGDQAVFPAKEIVDAGFLELVRYGIRSPDDPLILDSIKVVDSVLKIETPYGPSWRRYNHDGYGQRDNGEPYVGWGTGHAWPLLTGERGHYELAAGHDTKPFMRALEGFASPTGLLPEQCWDGADLPEAHMFCGRPTGAAMPLMWAHAEYIKLLRSTADGKIFDLLPQVAQRYIYARVERDFFEIWKPTRQVGHVQPGNILRIQMSDPFLLRWSCDEWTTAKDAESSAALIGTEFVDLPIGKAQTAPIRFTFFWPETSSWEDHDYLVSVVLP